jgi:hypothetical protein
VALLHLVLVFFMPLQRHPWINIVRLLLSIRLDLCFRPGRSALAACNRSSVKQRNSRHRLWRPISRPTSLILPPIPLNVDSCSRTFLLGFRLLQYHQRRHCLLDRFWELGLAEVAVLSVVRMGNLSRFVRQSVSRNLTGVH